MISFKNFSYHNILPPLLTGVIFLTGFFFLRPKVEELLKIKKEINAEKKKLAALTQKAAILESLDERELTQKSQFLLKVLPLEKEVGEILITIKALSIQEGVSVNSIQIQPGELATPAAETKNKEIFSSFPVSLKIEGELKKIINFLEKVQKTLPLMKIKTISLSFREGEKERASSSIDLEIPLVSLPRELGPIEAPLNLLTPQEEKVYQEISSEFTSPLITVVPLAEEGQSPLTPFIPPSVKENPFVLF